MADGSEGRNLTDEEKQQVVEAHDGFAGLRNALHRLAQERGHWAGMPMPLQDARIIIEPKWPDADKIAKLNDVTNPPKPELEDLKDAKLRNMFWSWHRRQTVAIWENGGKLEWGYMGIPNHAGKLMNTLMASSAWGVEQEANALQLLGTMLRHHMFKAYLLTGMFLERSPRSGVTYLFRKLRPTLALKESKDGEDMRILAALCLHPIAYYEDSWAGAMCPTDDVVAHLSLMRGDEHMFWRRANQHPAWRPEAGI